MRSIKWCHFQWPWTNFNPVFKLTPLFDAKYLTNGYRYGHRKRIGNRTQAFEWHQFKWLWVTSNPHFKVTITHSHGSVSCKGDDASQWRNPKFDPLPRSNPISDSHKSWQRWLRRGLLHLCKSSSRSAQGFRFRACVTLRTESVYSASFFSVFWVLATRYSQGPLIDFDAKYAKTRGSVQGCVFSGSRS